MNPGEPIHLTGALWLVPGEGGGRFPRSHSVLVRDGGGALIDTGAGPGALAELARREPVDLVLNTHSHPDHSASNALFPEAELRVPRYSVQTAGRLLPLSERFFDRELRQRWRRFVRRDMGFVDRRPTSSFEDGDELILGSTRAVVIHTPGHCADHCCIYFPEERALVSADLDLTTFGPWYGHEESDLEQLRRSVRRVQRLKVDMVISSHRAPVVRGIGEAFHRFVAVLDQREQRVRQFLEGGRRTWEELVDAALVYGRFPYEPELMRAWELEMVRKHVAELVARGEISPDNPAA